MGMSISIPIFLASDNAYAPFVASTIASICDNTHSFVEFYILDGGITPQSKNKIGQLKKKFSNFSIEYLDVKLPNSLKYKNLCPHVSVATYNRFLIPDLKPNIKRAIYLDVDTIALGDIADLWNIPLNEHTIAWVHDFCDPHLIAKFMKTFDLLNYYNAGVLLMDLDRWRKAGYTQQLFKLEQKVRDKIQFADQDLMNIIFQEDCVTLNPKYNCQYGGNKVVIRHFVNVFKPWKTNVIPTIQGDIPLPNFDDFWRYMKMTEFYPEVENDFKKSASKMGAA